MDDILKSYSGKDEVQTLVADRFAPKWSYTLKDFLKKEPAAIIDHVAEWAKRINPKVERNQLNDVFRNAGKVAEDVIGKMDKDLPGVKKLQQEAAVNASKNEVLETNLTAAMVVLGMEKAPYMYDIVTDSSKIVGHLDEKVKLEVNEYRHNLSNVKASATEMSKAREEVMKSLGYGKVEVAVLQEVADTVFGRPGKIDKNSEVSRILSGDNRIEMQARQARADFFGIVIGKGDKGLPAGVIEGFAGEDVVKSPATEILEHPEAQRSKIRDKGWIQGGSNR